VWQIDLLEGDKRMRGWILARCDHMQRHRAVKQQARLFAVWSSSTTLGISSRELHTDLAEAHERELNLQQQLTAESQKHERVATAMVCCPQRKQKRVSPGSETSILHGGDTCCRVAACTMCHWLLALGRRS
jgi:hypothetical protein